VNLGNFGNGLYIVGGIIGLIAVARWIASRDLIPAHQNIVISFGLIVFSYIASSAYWTVARYLAQPGETYHLNLLDYGQTAVAICGAIFVTGVIQFIVNVCNFSFRRGALLYISVITLSSIYAIVLK
jgi:hypothetical protein